MASELELALRIKADLEQARKQLQEFDKTVRQLDTDAQRTADSTAAAGDALNSSGDDAATAKPGVDKLTQALDGAAKSAQKTATATVAAGNALNSSGDDAATAKPGVDKLTQSLDEAARSAQETATATAAAGNALNRSGDDAATAKPGVDKLTQSLDGAAKSAQETATATGAAAARLSDLDADKVAQDFSSVGQSTDKASKSTFQYGASIQQAMRDVRDFEDANNGAINSMEDIAAQEQRLDRLMASGLITQKEYSDSLSNLDKAEARLNKERGKSERELEKVLRTADKTSAELRKLDAASDVVEKAFKEGRLSAQQYNKALASIGERRAQLEKTADSARKAGQGLNEAGRETERFRRNAVSLQPALTRLAGLLATAFSVREIALATETMTTIRNRLTLVTDSTEELNAAQSDVFNIAQATRQPLQDTAELYQRIATNADELELSASGVAGVVETINKTLAISNTTGPAASAALVQLSQAFASGVLRGEELNSVLEQSPALAKAISEGLGVTIGDLKSLGEEGKLSVQNILQALQSQGDAVDQQFQKIQVSGRQSVTRLGNSLTRMVGELDTATGASSVFADTVVTLSEYLDSGVVTDSVIEGFSIWSQTFSLVSQDIGYLTEDLLHLEGTGTDVAETLAAAFRDMPANLRTFIQLQTVEVASLFDKAVAASRARAEVLQSLFTSDTREEAGERLNQVLEGLNELREDSIVSILDETNAIKDAAKAERERREDERRLRDEARAERQKDIEELRKKAQENPIDLSSDSGSVTDAQRTQYVKKLEDEAAALRLTNGELREYENRQKGLTGALLERARAAQETIQLAEDEKDLAQLRSQLLSQQGREFDSVITEFEDKYGDLLKRLAERGDQENLDLVNKLLDVQKLQSRLSQAETMIGQSLSDQSQQEASINAQREAGLITEAEARRRIVQLHRETFTELQKQKPLLEELAKQPGVVGDQASQALNALQVQSDQLLSTMDLFQSTMRNSVESGLTDLITSLANGTASFGEAVSQLASTVANAIIEMQAQEIAQSISGSLFDVGEEGVEAAGDAAAATATATAITTAGTTAAGSMGASITAAGTGVGTAIATSLTTASTAGAGSMASAITTAGGIAAQTIASAMIAAGAASSATSVAGAATGGYITGPGSATSDSIPVNLSNGEFVTRAAVVAQDDALAFLHDFNSRGMAALDDWARVGHATGGLAGYPAPAMTNPTARPDAVADPSQDSESAVDVRFLNVVDPEVLEDWLQSPEGERVHVNMVKRNSATYKRILGIRN